MRHVLRLSFALLRVLCATLSVAQPSRNPLTLLRSTPSGDDVPLSSQLVFEFSRPLVPLGRMERQPEEIPITVPPLPCAWRWLNTTTLACELGECPPMARATRYTLTVWPGIWTEDGATLATPVTHTFLTQRPKVTDVRHQTWVSPGLPVLLILFDQPVTSSACMQHVYIHVSPKKRVAISASESLSAFGAYHGEFPVPQHGAVGWYRFALSADFASIHSRTASRRARPGAPGNPCGC